MQLLHQLLATFTLGIFATAVDDNSVSFGIINKSINTTDEQGSSSPYRNASRENDLNHFPAHPDTIDRFRYDHSDYQLLQGFSQRRLVVSHYMCGNIYLEHIQQDVDDAVAMGLDGFAINIGDPTQNFVRDMLTKMFNYCRKYPQFKLFFSLDVWASGSAHKGIYPRNDYDPILREFLGHPSYLRYGPQNQPLLSTFSDGGRLNSEWKEVLSKYREKIYFMPNMDHVLGYYESHPAFWEYWGNVIDGLFSWESAWVKRAGRGGEYIGDLSPDEAVVAGTSKHGKTYMMPLSALQYKNSYDTNLYRGGELNLPIRMEGILTMSPSPDIVQIITWNDGPESHYIGNLWKEQNNDTQPSRYATGDKQNASHKGWQSLFASFIRAYKAGQTARSMMPSGNAIEGALWYKIVTQDTHCPNEGYSYYSGKPDGFLNAQDVLNWAVVVPPSQSGYQIRLISNGKVISTERLVAGLNYGQSLGVSPGPQRMEILDQAGRKVSAAAGGQCVSSDCPDCIYNMNPQVVPVGIDRGDTGPCPTDIYCPIGPDIIPDNGGVSQQMIGFWDASALTKPTCAQRTVEDIPVGSLSHLNIAFAFISTEFDLYPMPGFGDAELNRIMNLKRRAPGLKIWISVGGPRFNDPQNQDTKGIWSSMSSTEANRQKFIFNLLNFVRQWNFDGVDFHWPYPSDAERGGTPADVINYVSLIKSASMALQGIVGEHGISISVPTSRWFLRGFDLDKLHPHVDWINLMPFQLNGDWTSDRDQPGRVVHAPTDIADIESVLDLFWKAKVPNNKVNLGISFQGRTYTLEDPTCFRPGCPYKALGQAGDCTAQDGSLSYAEIERTKESFQLETIGDSEAAIKWMTWNQDQWLAYDDDETLGMKVKFANEQKLRGLAIWSIDMDKRDHSALKALSGGILGLFEGQNYVQGALDGAGDEGDLISFAGFDCDWSACGMLCGPGTISAGAEKYCGVDGQGQEIKSTLCCSIDKAPMPGSCRWTGVSIDYVCGGACEDDEIQLSSSIGRFYQGSELKVCALGNAQYCCKKSRELAKVCHWTTQCYTLDGSGNPKGDNICGARKLVTTRGGNCGNNQVVAFCCEKRIDTSFCGWYDGRDSISKKTPLDCPGSEVCPIPGVMVQITTDVRGGWDSNTRQQKQCSEPWGTVAGPVGGSQYGLSPTIGTAFPMFASIDRKLSYCCFKDSLLDSIGISAFPVPMHNLFPDMVAPSNAIKYDVQLDRAVGEEGARADPNTSGFGFYIMTGPREEITSLHKRDGSHWDLLDCDNAKGETRQTVKAVCTNEGANGNCGDLFDGNVHLKVVEMPAACGPGKYAVAESMEVSTDHDHLHERLRKRGLAEATVYDFTFHYDFSKIMERGRSNIMLRIDYSDDPGYWQQIVAAPPDYSGATKRKREIAEEFNGDYKAWLEAQFHKEKRSMGLEELHKRWYSGQIQLWFDRMRNVDIEYTHRRHQISGSKEFTIINQDFKCPGKWTDAFDDMYVKAKAQLSYDIKAAAGVTLIGNLGDLKTFQQSHAWFRTSGSIDALLKFDARASMSFRTGPKELFGLQNFGATFRVPGIVTIGPNFRVIASLSGKATLEMTASYAMNFAAWDYSMRYPAPNPSLEKPQSETQSEVKEQVRLFDTNPQFQWNLGASGEIYATLKPVVELGIRFDSEHISDALLTVGVETFARIYGEASEIGQPSVRYCYGADGRADLFAQVDAPRLFNVDLSRYWSLAGRDFVIVPKKCNR